MSIWRALSFFSSLILKDHGFLKWRLAHSSRSIHTSSGVIIQPFFHLHEHSLLLPFFFFNLFLLPWVLSCFCFGSFNFPAPIFCLVFKFCSVLLFWSSILFGLFFSFSFVDSIWQYLVHPNEFGIWYLFWWVLDLRTMIQLLRKCLYIFQLKVIPQSVKNLVLCGYWNHIMWYHES